MNVVKVKNEGHHRKHTILITAYLLLSSPTRFGLSSAMLRGLPFSHYTLSILITHMYLSDIILLLVSVLNESFFINLGIYAKLTYHQPDTAAHLTLPCACIASF